jgi:tetratricopeptide (TPR) repeat protein
VAGSFRQAGLEVWLAGPEGRPTAACARLAGADERIGKETVILVARLDGDAEALVALPAVAAKLATRERAPRRGIAFVVAADPDRTVREWRETAPADRPIVLVEVEDLDGTSGRPAMRCASTSGLHRSLLCARRGPDVFLWIVRAPVEGPRAGVDEHVRVRTSDDHPFTRGGARSARSLGLAADFVAEVARHVADGEEDPPLGANALEEGVAGLLTRARRLAESRRYAEALRLAERALTEEPEGIEARLFRGEILLSLNRAGAARAEAEAALRLKPGDPGALLLRGRAAEAAGDEETALASYEKALTVKSNAPEALARRGLLRLRRARVKEALGDFDEALARDPALPAALKGKGMVHLYEREFDRAIASLDDAIRHDPEDWESWFYRAISRIHVDRERRPEDFRLALEDLASAIAADPGEVQPYVWRGNLLLGFDRFEEARADFDRAIAIDPKDSHLYFQRGLARLSLERYDVAIRDFERVIDLDPEESSAPYNIACAHARAGRPEHAVHWLERAVAAGFVDFDHMRKDPDLDSLRKRPDFQRLLRGNRAD